MSFVCFICSEPFTSPGTKHSLYATNCGHLIGLSCMEKWKSTLSVDNFKCPYCLNKMTKEDYHIIYNIPDEVNIFLVKNLCI